MRPCTAQTMDRNPRNMLSEVIRFGSRYTPLWMGFTVSCRLGGVSMFGSTRKLRNVMRGVRRRPFFAL